MSARAGGKRGRRWRAFAALAMASWAAAGLSQEGAEPVPITEGQLDELLESPPGAEHAATRRYAEADLEPYFRSGPNAAAKALFDRGRRARARALLRGDEPPVRYLRALAALDSDPAAAAAELRALAGDYPALRDHCLFHAADALARLRRRRAAAETYAQVSPGSTLFAEARLRQSLVLERALDLDGALEALAPVRALPAAPRNDAPRRKALLAAARLYQKKVDYAGEHQAMLELWATSPLSEEAEAVWPRLRELPIPNKWRLRRAESFLAFHDNREAIRLALQVKTPLPDEHACAAAFVVGSAYRKERQHRKAIASLAPMVEACRSSDLRPKAMYVLAYSQSVVAADDAVRTYDALAREYPGHPFADDALFLAAELDLRRERRREALERLELVASRYAEGNFCAEALFELGWQQRAAGAPGAALAAFDRLERLPGLGREQRLRGRYWRARVLAEKGDPSAAAAFSAIAADDPAGWYGLLARSRVGGAPAPMTCGGAAGSPPSPVARVWPLEAGPLGSDARFLAGVELLRLELPEAADELLAVERRGLPEDAARLLVEALKRTARGGVAARVTRDALGAGLADAMDGRNVDVWEAMYPRPFRKAVERWAKAARIDPDLLQALMREESLFNPWARSSTGAIGLTQLMPRTARVVARALNLARPDARTLQRPALNIRLGAAYLAELLSQLDGSTVRAVAAYNAGPQAVLRWVADRPGAELDAWVEEIPVWETRDYVKHVLGSYGAYRFVYGAALAVLDETGRAAEARGSTSL
ncbi:MAG TPA: lytic transglycosylase domain-containing protein [Anaeromyxobacter sp.]